MPVFEAAWQMVVTVSATVAAVGVVAIYRRVDNLANDVEKHDRTLYGEPGVDEWNGLVSRVAYCEIDSDREDGE